MRPIIKALGQLAVLLLAAALLGPGAAQAQNRDETCFPQTGQCVSGRFRQFWQQNGGLAVFGYPITPARDEVNPESGQSFQTQWFERTRFELHPENPAPYDVLLGRLGRDALANRGVDWQTLERPGSAGAGCRLFAETGHTLCDRVPDPAQPDRQPIQTGFRRYWEQHGLADPKLSRNGRSLALFGAPLTEPRIETNSSGRRVLAQHFERARFELPLDQSQGGPLQGRLGAELRANLLTPAAVAANQASPRAIVPSEQGIYWITSSRGNTINMVLRAGGGPRALLEDTDGIRSLAADASGVYWTSSNAVRKIGSDGAAFILAGGQSSPNAIATDQDSVYWANGDGTINRVSKAGGSATPLASGLSTTSVELALDETSLYWISDGLVQSAPKTGGEPRTLADLGRGYVWRLALEGDSVYVAGYRGDYGGTLSSSVVTRIPKAGGPTETRYSGPERPLDLAVSGGRVYWSSESGQIYRTDADGITTLLVSGQDAPGSIALDQGAVYWANNRGGGAVMRAGL